MAQRVKGERGWGRRGREQEETRQVLLDGLTQTRKLIAQAYSGFNTAGDPDLIESFVYEINALQARYTYLLRQVKALDQVEQPQQIVAEKADRPRDGGVPGSWKPLSAYR